MFYSHAVKDKAMKKIFVKTTTYGMMHLFITFCVAWVVSGSLPVALGISLIEPAIQVMGYFIHEKIWSRSSKTPAAENFDFSACCTPFIPSAKDKEKK